MNRTGETHQKKRMTQSKAVRLLSSICAFTLLLDLAILGWNLHSSNQFDAVLDARDEVLHAADLLNSTSKQLTSDARAYCASGIEMYYDSYYDEINTTKNRETASAVIQSSSELTAEEESLLKTGTQISAHLADLELEAMEAARRGDMARATELLYSSEYLAGQEAFTESYDSFLASYRAHEQVRLDRLGSIIDYTFYASFAILVLGIGIQVTMIWYVMRRILSPLVKIEENMVQFAQGNLGVELDVPVDDTEIGTLAGAIVQTKAITTTVVRDINYTLGQMSHGNFMVDFEDSSMYVGDYIPILNSMEQLQNQQSATLLQIDSVADQVSTDSHQVASGAQASAQGATEQAASIEELSSIIEDISHKTAENAQSVVEANQLAEKAGQEVAAGNEKMTEMVAAMKDISMKSSEIANIIHTIDDIAFQINLLALNAAVEAARAGSAGKGFAVVAGEVKNLANKSAKAAANTTELIASSLEAVERGTTIANETAAKLQGMVENTEAIMRIIREIEMASAEQTSGTAQVAEGITQISSVIQTNSATAQESAAASEELSAQADTLKSLVGQFQLNAEGSTSYE